MHDKKGASSLPPSAGSRRRRGAQPGNTNAVKSGFYSRQYYEMVAALKKKQANYDFSTEIRGMCRLLFRLAESDEAFSTSSRTLLTLRTISQASRAMYDLILMQAARDRRRDG